MLRDVVLRDRRLEADLLELSDTDIAVAAELRWRMVRPRGLWQYYWARLKTHPLQEALALLGIGPGSR